MNDPPDPIVFILGLSHVGSTLVDLTLGSHPRYVGLGEIFQVIRPDFNRFELDERCSCGSVRSRCPFWGPAAAALKKHPEAGLRERYEIVFQTFRRVFGPHHVAVDSSKLPEAFETVRSLKNNGLKVIYLIRDVRAWTISRLAARRRSPAYFGKDGNYVRKLAYHYGWKARAMKRLFPLLTNRPAYYFLLWYYQNRRLQRFLSDRGIDHFCLSYDELGLRPEPTIARLFDYLGESEFDAGRSSAGSRSHILVGSVGKADPRRRQGIFYDNRWIYSNEWLPSAAMFPGIMRYNTTQVYPNIRDNSIWR